jgi:hypothetical protein
MPLLTDGNRFLVDQLNSRINQVVFGFDGTVATSEDGGAGRPAYTAVPTTRIVDDHTIYVEAVLPLSSAFTLPLREVCIQYQNPSDATDTTVLFRYTFQSVSKTSNNELRFATIIEVN